ncbi:MAG: hypothetical protein NT175_02625 [Bacteroidetes bacterium]|nr:hypothetical protein [Bacteroidota bacterium]
MKIKKGIEIVIFLFSSYLCFSQQPSIEINDPQKFKFVLDECANKIIDLYCPEDYMKNWTYNHVLKITTCDEDDNRILMIFGPPGDKDESPFNVKNIKLGYFENENSYIFILADNIIINDSLLSGDNYGVVQKKIDNYISPPRDKNDGAISISPMVFLFDFNKDLLKMKKGIIHYKAIYPLSHLEKKYWPLEYDKMNLPLDLKREDYNTPWNHCTKDRILTEKELEKLKEGEMKINFRKHIQKK